MISALKEKGKIKQSFFAVLLVGLLIMMGAAGVPLSASAHTDAEDYNVDTTAPQVLSMTAGNTSAAAMTVMEVSSRRVLYSKNKDNVRPMASTTKVLTAIVVIENAPDLDKVIEVSPKAVGIEGSSIYLAPNEKISIRDLLYGLMLRSGNDSAVALAIAVGGSVEGFAKMMNDFAAKIGAVNSNFTNPHGLHDDNHYTTAYDLALISAYAMNNPTFREIAGSKRHNATWEGRDYPRVMVNKNKILNLYQGGNGIKTGFTKKAGRCLVSSAERDGMTVVCVVLNCGPMFEECMALMSTAFDNYELTELVTPYTALKSLPVLNGRADSVAVAAKEGFCYPLTAQEKEAVKVEHKTPPSVKAPVNIGAQAGGIEITLDNRLIFSTKTYTMESVKRLTLFDKIGRLFKD